MQGYISSIIGAAGVLLGIIFSYLAFFRSRTKDCEDEGKQTGVVLTELGYIKAGVDEIKTEQRQQRDNYVAVVSRLTAVEQSAKQAHKRIDRLDGMEVERS